MKHSYLEVTYRKGLPLAAYYYLPRPDDAKNVRTEHMDGGLLVDYSADGKPIGVEITSPAEFNFAQVNQLLERLGYKQATREDFAPLRLAA
jgi:uncharacterized protein YuzE